MDDESELPENGMTPSASSWAAVIQLDPFLKGRVAHSSCGNNIER